MQLMAWVRTGWLQLGVWWSHLRIESVISIQEGKKSKYTGSLRNQLLMFHTTVFIQLSAADESKITIKRCPRINAAPNRKTAASTRG